ncbi:MAG: ABC transporter ATP-binding protein [Eubacteriales bacterium]|nr:ABC transporter ATP-binding protein [Eubacteriales bacterium]
MSNKYNAAEQRRLEKQAREKARESFKRFKVKDFRATMRRIFSYVTEYRLLFFTALFLVALRSGLLVSTNLLLKPIINSAVEGLGMPVVIRYIILIGLVYLAAVLVFYFGERLLATIAENVTRKIRSDLFAHTQKLPLVFFDGRSHGELMSSYTNDLNNLNSALEETLGTLVANAVSFVGLFITMLIMSPILSALVILILGLQLLAVRKISSKSAEHFRKRQAAIADLNGFVEEMISGQKVIKVFNHEAQTVKEFDYKNEQLKESGTKATTFSTIMMPIMMNLAYVQFAIISLIGAIMTIRHSFGMDIGTLVAFLQASRNFSNPVVQIAQQFNSLVAAMAGAERIFAILDEPLEIDQGEVKMLEKAGQSYWEIPRTVLERKQFRASGLACDESQLVAAGGIIEAGAYLLPVRGDIRFKDVNFGYSPGQEVLKNISLYAKPSQKIAFVGSTGAGKTTIVNLLTRFYEINSGSISFDGIDLRDIQKADLRRALGMVLQDIHLFSGSIRDNIRYGKLEASDEELIAAAKYANAHDFIMDLPDGYEHQIDPDGGNLSQGQRQLISIARAAVKDPEVLILDEATSSIDTRTERFIEQGMDQLMQDRTSFAIAHRLSTVRHAAAILLLENGEIIERGSHDDLMAKAGKYYELNMGKAKLS